jgi:type I restriction enzyme S subunit
MASDWKDMSLGEFVRLQRGHDLPEANRRPGSVPIMGSGGQNGVHDTVLAKGPGVVIGRSGVGSMGVVSYCPTDYWPHNTVLYVTDFLGNDQRFVYYFLSQLNLRRFDSGSAQASLNRNYIYPIRIQVPDPCEQRAISQTLGVLDDKMVLNQRMNNTLEAIVGTTFRSWFVDFDPVRAKVEGRDPNLPQPLADLFPARFVNSALGEIPEGWKVAILGDVAEHPRRGVAPCNIAPGTPYIALEHMPRHCIALAEWGVADELESNKFEFKTGEILFGKLRPYFHKVGVAPADGVCSTDIVVVSPKAPRWFGFTLGHMSSKEFVEYTNAASTGTKMPRTSWSDMACYRLVVPPDSVAEAFANLAQPFLSRINANIHESRTLTALRDGLLPKLVSGDMRVPALTSCEGC